MRARSIITSLGRRRKRRRRGRCRRVSSTPSGKFGPNGRIHMPFTRGHTRRRPPPEPFRVALSSLLPAHRTGPAQHQGSDNDERHYLWRDHLLLSRSTDDKDLAAAAPNKKQHETDPTHSARAGGARPASGASDAAGMMRTTVPVIIMNGIKVFHVWRSRHACAIHISCIVRFIRRPIWY
jgi:hypothetical protein